MFVIFEGRVQLYDILMLETLHDEYFVEKLFSLRVGIDGALLNRFHCIEHSGLSRLGPDDLSGGPSASDLQGLEVSQLHAPELSLEAWGLLQPARLVSRLLHTPPV